MCARGSSLSDDKVIETANRDFVALDLSVDKHGFPTPLPSLSACEQVRKKFSLANLGYQTSMIVSSDGQTPLATAGASSLKRYDQAIQWNAKKYLKFLAGGLKTHERLAKLLPQRRKREQKKIGEAVVKEYWESSDQVAQELTGKPVPR